MMPFDPLAGTYERFRPSYPAALLADFSQTCASRMPDLRMIADIGCGTGISTRALRTAFGTAPSIIGVEPAGGMLDQALASTADAQTRFINARAEELPLEDGAIDVVFAAQAVQWFDRPAFYREAERVLRTGCGTIGLCQNNRDWSESPFLEAYETLLEDRSPEYTRDYRAFDIMADLRGLAWTEGVGTHSERWNLDCTIDHFIGLALSSTKVQSAADVHGCETIVAAIQSIANAYAVAGCVSLPYRCELYTARKR